MRLVIILIFMRLLCKSYMLTYNKSKALFLNKINFFKFVIFYPLTHLPIGKNSKKQARLKENDQWDINTAL